MKQILKKYKNILIVISIIIFVMLIYLFYNASFSSFIDNGERVEEESDLTYYIDVLYDGIDSSAITSSDTATAEVNSYYIFVEDILPANLVFKEFVRPASGTDIGAVSRSDDTISCSGYVVGGYDGLTYDATTRKISFKVKNLQAGCKLTVGITTTTPSLGNSTRLDFYNTAYARENTFSMYSNTTHTFMGRDSLILHSISYKYDESGIIPENAPDPPAGGSYDPDTLVNLVSEPVVPGYDFSGWKAEGITVNSDNTFIMPSTEVTFVGTFTEKTSYSVIYSLDPPEEKPSEYQLPDIKTYGVGDYFKIDLLKAGDIINGYQFKGWNIDNITGCVQAADSDTTGDIICPMPENDVSIVGGFEKVKYNVSYQFKGSNIPSNAESLLPTPSSYIPGQTVTIADEPTATGYKFLGWQSGKTFTMPEENVVIYGEWIAQTGTFSPTITMEKTDTGDTYSNGDEITFTTTITNTASFEITDVLLKSDLNINNFIESESYTVLSNGYIKIPSIPASETITLTSKFTVGTEVFNNYTNKIELTGALASNNYYLDTTKKYIAEISFKVSNISINIEVFDRNNNELTEADFALYDTLAGAAIATGKKFDKLDPNKTYYLEQTQVTNGYVAIDKATINIDNNGNVTIEGYEVTNNNGTATIKIINRGINMLPETGGVGTIPYTIIGLVIIIVSSYLYITYLKKKGVIQNV